MREQQAIHTLRAHRADVQTQGASRRHVGMSSGIHPEDRPHLTDERRPSNRQPIYDDPEDDAFYDTRMPTSTRRYAPAPATKPPPRTVMRVTRHQGLPPNQRVSSTQAPVYQQPELADQHQRKPRLHLSVYIGLTMVCMVLGWIALSSLTQWWQMQQDTLHYGYPRTFQIDADVRHGGISHFTVENLNGHIIITEVQVSNLAKTHVYSGPVFSGSGADTQPATISFEDVNGDGYPDMVIAVGAGRYTLINDHSGFRAVTSTDVISGKGV